MDSITSNLKNELSKKLSDELGKTLNTGSENVGDFLKSAEHTMKSIGENDEIEEEIIRKKMKKGLTNKLVGQSKLNLPIGKIYSMGKKENKEATSAASGGGFVTSMTMTKGEMMEKWSQKYKDSIDCSNPKGFSQKAHCQGKKKSQNESFEAPKLTMFSDEAPKKLKKKSDIQKTETKEATGASSAGAYVTPAAWAKSTSKKDWRGKSKTLFPGGQFVQVKKKCKKFPYCNQGDTKALNFSNESVVKKIITKLSEKYNISEDYIEKLILKEYYKVKQ
jgi:hypothetical protein